MSEFVCAVEGLANIVETRPLLPARAVIPLQSRRCQLPDSYELVHVLGINIRPRVTWGQPHGTL